jgi:hypothetical protein
MNHASWFTTLGNYLLIVAAFPATLSVIMYMRVPWQKSQLGRHLFLYMLATAIVLDLSVWRIFFTGLDHFAFLLVRIAAFLFLIFVLWWRLVVVVRAQRIRKRPAASKHSGDEQAHDVV